MRGNVGAIGRRLISFVTLTALVALASCGDATTTAPEPVSPADAAEPITQRAIAAIALDHLPQTTSSRQASFTDVNDPQGALGADLRYGADGEDDGDLVRVYLTPDTDSVGDCTERCDQRPVDGGTLSFGWGPEEPEEDPGSFGVALALADQTISASFFGPTITKDPRQMAGLLVTPEMLEAIVLDPRLRGLTTQAVLDAGEALEDWDGGEPDPESYRVLDSDAESLAAFWRTSLDWYGERPPRITSVTDSPLVDSLGVTGSRHVSARITLDSTRWRPYDTLDLIVSKVPPANSATPPCKTPLAHCDRGNYGATTAPTYVTWNDGPDGVVWVFYRRSRSSYLTARFTGWDVPASWEGALPGDLDWLALIGTFSEKDYFGFTTTKEYADQQVP